MKYILLLLLPINAFAQVTPKLDSGEVKVLYPCESTSGLALEKEEREHISFYEMENNAIYASGFILRRRQNTEINASDFTVKYRSKSPSLTLDQNLFSKLSDSKKGELKCEFDAGSNYQQSGTSYSCSFKSDTTGFLPEHHDFIKMVNKPLPQLPNELSQMKEIKISSTSWKLKLTPEQKKASPLDKKPSVEKWVIGDRCLLEVSGKITTPVTIEQGLKFIRSIIPHRPSGTQEAKTAWALGQN